MDRSYRKEDIKALIDAMEDAMGITCVTASHFEIMSQHILNHSGEYLSPTTLKRIWGYLKEDTRTRTTSLSIISRSLGFKDWNDFLKRNETANDEKTLSGSNPAIGKTIEVVKDLKLGDRIMLFWYPGRECLVRYLGGIDFEVESSQKTRLQPGDIFSTHLFVAGHPLYLSNLRRKNCQPVAYICGRVHGGISFKKLDPNSKPK